MMAFISMTTVLLFQVTVQYVVSFWISPSGSKSSTLEKLSAYECGLEPMGDARMKFEIQYYVIGIQFLIFDLEIIFLVPLTTILFSLNSFIAFLMIFFFLTVLTIGFVYEWFLGALNITA